MSWLKLDDDFPDGVKLSFLTETQSWRWVRVLCYCARFETDGLVPAPVLKRIGLWDLRGLLLEKVLLDDRNGELWVHDYLEYNPSKAQLEEERARWREYKQQSRKGRNVHGGVSGESLVGSLEESSGVLSPSAHPASRTRTPRNPQGAKPAITPGASLAQGRAREANENGGVAQTTLSAAADLLEAAGIGSDDPRADMALELALRVPAALLEELEASIPAHSLDPGGYVLSSLRAAVGAL